MNNDNLAQQLADKEGELLRLTSENVLRSTLEQQRAGQHRALLQLVSLITETWCQADYLFGRLCSPTLWRAYEHVCVGEGEKAFHAAFQSTADMYALRATQTLGRALSEDEYHAILDVAHYRTLIETVIRRWDEAKRRSSGDPI